MAAQPLPDEAGIWGAWFSSGRRQPLCSPVRRAWEKAVGAGGAQGRRPTVVMCPQTSKALPAPLKVLCHLGSGRSTAHCCQETPRRSGHPHLQVLAPPKFL